MSKAIEKRRVMIKTAKSEPKKKRLPIPEPVAPVPCAFIDKDRRSVTFPDESIFLRSLQVLEQRLSIEFFSE